MKEAIQKAQQLAQQKMLKSIAAKKAAEARAEKKKKEKREKIDPYKAARALAGDKASSLLKIFWAAWRVGVKICHQMKMLENREKAWRSSCIRDHRCVGNCGACNILKDSKFKLPYGAEAHHLPSLHEVGSATLAANRLGTADTYTWNARGLDASPMEHRAGTAPSWMGLNRSMPSLATALPTDASNYGYDGEAISRARTPLLKGGKWEEATRWASGRKCWYNKVTGQITYIDPVHHDSEGNYMFKQDASHLRHHTEAEHLAAEAKADYLHAKASGHFRDIHAATSGTVKKLDMGSTIMSHYPMQMRRH